MPVSEGVNRQNHGLLSQSSNDRFSYPRLAMRFRNSPSKPSMPCDVKYRFGIMCASFPSRKLENRHHHHQQPASKHDDQIRRKRIDLPNFIRDRQVRLSRQRLRRTKFQVKRKRRCYASIVVSAFRAVLPAPANSPRYRWRVDCAPRKLFQQRFTFTDSISE